MNAIAIDLARGLDPVRIAATIGMEPDAWQTKALRSGAPRMLMNCCRQSGKSTTGALLALHTALYKRGALVLVISASERQGRELFRVAVAAYRALGKPVDSRAESGLALELANDSRIVVVPSSSDTIRGFAAVDMLVLDEAARIEDETYASIRPMLAVSHGRIIAMSTPFGRRGWWWQAWQSNEDWERFTVRADEVPRISPAFLAEEERTIGTWFYRQEYLCEFADAATAAFSQEDVDNAFDPEVVVWSL